MFASRMHASWTGLLATACWFVRALPLNSVSVLAGAVERVSVQEQAVLWQPASGLHTEAAGR